VSHTSAAALWDAELRFAAMHVRVPSGRNLLAPGVTVHRGLLGDGERRIRDGIPVTSPARTLLDCAGLLEDEDLEALMEDFLRRGLTTHMSIERTLRGKGTGTPGAHRLRALLDDRDGAALEFRLEVKLWRLLRSAGLRPVRQFEVICNGRRYRLDFAWPMLKVALEADGFASHGGHRAFVQDRNRLADLAAEHWLVIPVTWDACVAAPDEVIANVRRALKEAA
jgi:very-short-patch-repair endonuclease